MLFATNNDTAEKIVSPKILELQKLRHDQLIRIFLKERGVRVPDLTDYIPVTKSNDDKGQQDLTQYLGQKKN